MRDWTTAIRERLRTLGDAAPDEGLVEELAAHLDQAYDEARTAGVADTEARGRALALLEDGGALGQTVRARRPRLARRVKAWSRREPAIDFRPGGRMPHWNPLVDLRHALRLLVRAPGFSAVAVATFAIGIGVNTAVFSVVHGVLLAPLPYPDADRITLVWLDNRRQNIREDITSYPTYRDWRDRNTSFEHLAAFSTQSFTVTGAGEPERIIGAIATANFFDVMGLPPVLGRVFTADREASGDDEVIVLSYGLWQRRFGGRTDVLGETIALNGRPYEVIGVMPPELRWPARAELWSPLAPGPQLREARGSFWLPVIGRLKPEVTVEQAQTEMSGISSLLEQEHENMRGFGAYVVPLHRQIVGDVERGLLVLLGAVGCVLLIACANLANLLVGRTLARRKELAIRTALGARRWRLVRQIMTETLVLAAGGGVVGLLLASWSTGFFVALGGDSIPRADGIGLDGQVLLFALALVTLSALVAGLLPALQASRATGAEHLREGGRQDGGAASHRTRGALVGVEVALAFVLLTGAGLLAQTLWRMQEVDRGFTAERIATMTVSAPAAAYAGPPEVRAFYERLLDRIRALPGVEAAAAGTGVLQPLVTRSAVFSIEGQPLPPPEERIEYPFETVSPGFFETLGIEVVAGRTFTGQDHADAPRVIVINQTLARLAWPGQDPIGRRLRPGGPDSEAPWMTVVGVIRDVHRADVTRAVRPELYMAALQSPPRTQMLLVRVAGDPTTIIPAVRRELQAIDPQLPLYNAGTLEGELAAAVTRPRFQATLLAGFALVALLLAAVGIYGVTSHAVSQRTQEVGIRMALGAGRRDVLAMMLGQHLRPALAGVVAGLLGAVAVSQYLQSLLYGVGATDPLTLASMALVLLGVAVVACWIPARRATRVDPLVAVRAE
jgi:putative ABC transport system permease protein